MSNANAPTPLPSTDQGKIDELHLFISRLMFDFDPDEGSRASEFLDSSILTNFSSWLHIRKIIWTKKSRSFKIESDNGKKRQKLNDSTKIKKYHDNDDDVLNDPEEGSRVTYFLDPTINSTSSWILSRKMSWRNSWRVGKDKSKGEVSIDMVDLNSCFLKWLTKSKNIWKESLLLRKNKHTELLLDSDNRQKSPKDILPLFDPLLGLPDDVVAYALTFLPRQEHIHLLCINKATSRMIKTRDCMWRALCPNHWTLPKRPRKPWYQIYLTGLNKFEESKNKRSDDLLIKASGTLAKGDYLQTFAKIVCDGERNFGFEVDYTSGTVEERNSLLNLAVINGRHKCVRWLMDVKNADIETSDRGLFTPLCNAAWNGDVQMVRYLMRQGASRRKIAKFHSSSGIAPKQEGLTPEEWARKRGHHSIADLIHKGL